MKRLKKKFVGKRTRKKGTPEEEVLYYWEKCGGKVFTSQAVQGNKRTSDYLYNLFLEGSPNPYVKVLKENQDDLRLKGWTVKEIKQAIWFYAKYLDRPIDKFPFYEFVLSNFAKFQNQYKKEVSYLADIHMEILKNPEILEVVPEVTKSDKWLISKLKGLRPDELISQKVFRNVCKPAALHAWVLGGGAPARHDVLGRRC